MITSKQGNGAAGNGAASAFEGRGGDVAADRIFADSAARPKDFAFDARTADVFDDMVSRSVPFYDEIQRMIGELSADFAVPGTNLYDLGCATATTLATIDGQLDPAVRFVGIDNSEEMLARARAKLSLLPPHRERSLILGDLHDAFTIENASVVLLTLTLQFVRPLQRQRVIETIASGMNPGGCLILVEKLCEDDSQFNRLFIEHYHQLKRRHGYSEIEVANKREALENVLIPYRLEENEALLRAGGLSRVRTWFRWYNFCGMIAVR